MAALRSVYRWLVRRVPPRVAWGLWRAGELVAAPRRRRQPGPEVAVAHVAFGLSEGALAALVERLVEGAESPAAVLVVSDADSVHVAAARGCRLEHVPARADWLRAVPDGSYETFLSERGRAIGAAYRIARLEAGPEAPEPLRRALEEGPPPRRRGS